MFKTVLKLNLQRFAEEGGIDLNGGDAPQTVTVGDREMTLDQIAELAKSYDKLQSQFTKVSQENSNLKQSATQAEGWLQFEKFLQQYPPEVIQSFQKNVDDFFSAVNTGTVTQQSISGIDKAIRTAEKAGDTQTADALRDERDEALAELMVDKEISSLAKLAKTDGIDFDEDEFKDYLAKYLEDEGLIDENDEWDTKEIKRAYKAYKLDQKEKALNKPPAVGTGGSGISATKGKDKGPKSIKEAFQRYMGT